MSYYENSYKQLLFGVSQQAPQDRLDGQVSAQVNMLSDVVSGVRRRPGVELDFVAPWQPLGNPSALDVLGTLDPANLAFYETVLSTRRILFVVDVSDGSVYTQILSGDFATITMIGTGSSYLQASTPDAIQFSNVQGAVFMVNTEVAPTTSTPGFQGYDVEDGRGWFYVSAGSYSTQYKLEIVAGPNTFVGEYTTPDGTSAAHIAQSRPENISSDLTGDINTDAASAGFGAPVATREGAYVFVYIPGLYGPADPMYIEVQNSHDTLITSGLGHLNDAARLPAKLPTAADGYVMSTGNINKPVYFEYDSASLVWRESAKAGERTKLNNMPAYAYIDTPKWHTGGASPSWEPRKAGDTTTNPDPAFTRNGITGIGAFQGRLVLLAGEYICMSSSETPMRFYRASVASVLDADPIEVASTTERTNPLKYAVVYDKSLYVSSIGHQERIRGDIVITPSNASPAVVAYYQGHPHSAPIPIDQTLLLPYTRTAGQAGVWELYPSDAADDRLAGTDITGHIPAFIDDDIAFMQVASSAGLVLIGSRTNRKRLVVHEYMRVGSEKPHQAWHAWEFTNDIVYAYIDNADVYLLFHKAGAVTDGDYSVGKVSLRKGSAAGDTTVYLDYAIVQPVIDATLLPPNPLLDAAMAAVGNPLVLTLTLDTLAYALWNGADIVAVPLTGDGAYTECGVVTKVIDYLGTPMLCVGVPGGAPGDYVFGIRYTSSVTPTPPVVRDRNGVAIYTQKSVLLKYVVSVRESGLMRISAKDYRATLSPFTTGPRLLSTPGFTPGDPERASAAVCVPLRLDANSAEVELSTDTIYDLNIPSIEYGIRYTQRNGRRS